MFDFVREFLVWISKATEISFEQVRVLFLQIIILLSLFLSANELSVDRYFCNTLVGFIFQNIIVWKDTCLPHKIFCQVLDKG